MHSEEFNVEEHFKDYEKQLVKFFNTIRDIRKEDGLKISDVAKETGIEPSYLSRMERGERSNPSFYHVVLLADYFGIDLYDVYRKPVRK